MTQIPHDQLAKQYLEEFLTSLGTVQRQYEVPGEAKYIDVWFVPNRPDRNPYPILASSIGSRKECACSNPTATPPPVPESASH